jgi:Protein of unknown function, DUF481
MGERAGIALCLISIFAADWRAAAANAEVAATAAQVASPPAAATTEAPTSTWTVKAGVNLIYLRASARTLTFSGHAAVERKIPEWIFGVKASGAYGTSRPSGSADSQVVALAAALQARVDRRFSQSVSAYVLGGIETDHVQSVESREFGEAGASMVWFDIREADYSKIFLRTDLGLRYQYESRFQYYPTPMREPGVTLVAPRLGAVFRYAFNKGTIFSEEAEVLPNVTGEARVLINSQSKLTTLLTGVLSFAAGFGVKFDSAPAPGKVDTETTLTLGLEVAF